MRCLGQLLLSFFSFFSLSANYQDPVIEDMRDALHKLYPHTNNSFVFTSPGIEHPEIFSNLKVNKFVSFRLNGNLHILHDKFVEAMREMGNSDENLLTAAATELVKLTERVIAAEGYENALVMFRGFPPNDLYVVPRWHIDGNFFRPHRENAPKFAIALKGPSTLFQPSDCDRTLLFKNFNNLKLREVERDRQKLAELFPMENVITPKRGEGAFFIVGRFNEAAVHSEPNITEERIFISIMGATDEQIAERVARWGVIGE